MDQASRDRYDRLVKIRDQAGFKLKPTPLLRSEVVGVDGVARPLILRDYQSQMVAHLVSMPRFVVGDDTGLGKCQPGNSIVLTDHGLLEMGSIEDWASMEPDSFRPLSRPLSVLVDGDALRVKSFYRGGVKSVVSVTTRCGFKNEGSLVHPVLVRRDGMNCWVQVRDLKVGDHVCIERREMSFPASEPALFLPDTTLMSANTRVYDVPRRLTPDLARLLAYVVGEGWVNHRESFSVSQDASLNPETRGDIQGLIRSQLRYDLRQDDAPTMQISSIYLREFLRLLGVLDGVAKDKVVPWCVMRATRESVRQFLMGYFDGEGSVGDGVEVSSASEVLLRQVQLLLLRFGIVSRRSTKHVKGRDHVYWRLTIFGDDARIFQKKIGFISRRKIDALAKICVKKSNTNLDVVPNAADLVRTLDRAINTRVGRHGHRGGGIVRFLGEPLRNAVEHVLHGRRDISYVTLQALVCAAERAGVSPEETAGARQVLDSHFFYDPVTSLQHGEAEVFDLEVDDPRHSFVANGFINHNTIESIASLCYLWAREPDLRVLILTKKSAVRQWADEIQRFTEGVRVVVAKGTKQQRENAYEAFALSDGPTVLLCGHRTVVQDITLLQDRRWGVLIVDECFDYHTPIILEDGSTELIGKIVSKKMPVRVLSFNHATGQVEPKAVTGWFRKPRQQGGSNGRRMIRMEFRYSGRVITTSSHEFYRLDGSKITARRLRVGGRTVHLCMNAPTDVQKQVIFGSLLGDACVSMPGRTLPGVQFGHALNQIELLNFKHRVLAPLGTSRITVIENLGFPKKDGTPKLHGKFRLNGNAVVSATIDRFEMIREGKKRISLDWLNEIGPLGLAVWYADDGVLRSHTQVGGIVTYEVSFCTHGFPLEDQRLLVGWLRWKFGIMATIRSERKRTDRDVGQIKVYPYIHLDQEATQKFFALLPGMLPGVEYKFPPGIPILDESVLDLMPKRHIIEDVVTLKEAWTPALKEKFVYDIEVKDNHNYFANGTLVSNCTVVKNPAARVHKFCEHLSKMSDRVWGLTATLIKNNLVEGYGIYRVVFPELFKQSPAGFQQDYCVLQMINIGRGRKIPKIVGYRSTDVARFRMKIDPYYLGRPKHLVAKDLPPLVTKRVEVGMSDEQRRKYKEALTGLLTVGDDEKEVTKLTAVTYCQEIVNHLGLIGCEGPSEKLDELVDMLTDGELVGKKTIVFTRFEKMVDIGITALDKVGIRCVRITGKESEDERKTAQDIFQDLKSDVQVVWITTAGSDSINLQSAEALVCYDTPFAAGDYIQVVGRMVRLGSIYDRVVAIHLLVEGSIDEKTMDMMERKMDLVEAVLGKRLKGEEALDDFLFETEKSGVSELFDSLRHDAMEMIRA